MGIFICEKCGRLDNTANRNNYWIAMANKYKLKHPEEFYDGSTIVNHYKNDYFNTHVCCSICCIGLEFSDGSSSDNYSGDVYGVVTDKTYKEMSIDTLKACYNYEDFKDEIEKM